MVHIYCRNRGLLFKMEQLLSRSDFIISSVWSKTFYVKSIHYLLAGEHLNVVKGFLINIMKFKFNLKTNLFYQHILSAHCIYSKWIIDSLYRLLFFNCVAIIFFFFSKIEIQFNSIHLYFTSCKGNPYTTMLRMISIDTNVINKRKSKKK